MAGSQNAMKCSVRISALVALIAGLTIPARAQTPAAPPEPPPRLEASAQFTFLGTTGNASSQSLGAGGDVTWRPDPWTYNAKAIFAQNETEGDLSARSFAGLFRASRKINERLSAYGQYDFLRDVFAGVEQRHIVEGGVSYLAVDQGRHRLRLDGGLGYLYQKVAGRSLRFGDAVGGGVPVRHFSDERVHLRAQISSDAGRCGRLEVSGQVAALTVAMSDILSLKISHTIRYSAEPPEGFETTDTIAAVSLVAKMRRPK